MKMKHRECHCWVWERLSKEWEKEQPAKKGRRLVHGVAFVGRHSTMTENKRAESDSV